MPIKDHPHSRSLLARQPARGRVNKRPAVLAVLAVALAGFGATAAGADAAIGSASVSGSTATLNLDGANDNETVSVSGGLLVHAGTGGSVSSSSDWDSATAGDQT